MKTTKEMREEIKDYVSEFANGDIFPTTHVKTVSTKFVTLINLTNCKKSKITLGNFYDEHIMVKAI